MIYFNADIRRAHARSDDSITSGSVGIPVALALDSAFDGLAKTLCFKTATASVDIALVGDTTESTVPPDVISTAGEWLYIGIYAADGDGNIVIPTAWANAGKIEQGTIPSGVDPSEPTPSWVAQVQNIASEALETANSVREDADSGKFDGEPGEAGTNGTTFIPSVDAAGVISWVNDGGLPNPQTRNIKGPKGDKLTYADLTPADKADLVQGPIAEAQTAAVAAINQAGTTQVGNVNTAGATQVRAVTDKGAEVINSIPADYTELSEDVADLKSAVSNADMEGIREVVGLTVWNEYKVGLYKISDGLFIEDSTYICTAQAINVNPKDVILVHDFPVNSSKIYVLFYNNNTFVSQVNYSITNSNFYIPVPENITRVNIDISFTTAVEQTGIIPPSVIINQSKSLLMQLSAMQTGDATTLLPSYWQYSLRNKINGIQDFSKRSAIGDTFIFFTDYHLKTNAQNTPNLIRALLANSDIRFVVHGGDVITQESTQSEAFATLAEYNKSFYEIPLFNVIGNHDQNNPGNTDQDYQLTNEQAYSMLCKKREMEYVASDGFDYCFDNKAQKIRYFVVGAWRQSWIVTAQVRWICSQFLDVPDGYSIFVFSHIGATSEGVNGNFTPILDAMTALKNKQSYHYSVNDYNYANKNVNVIGAMSGHVHYDCSYITESGIPVIGVTTDSIGATHPSTTMTIGTDTEQAFDIVRIDTANRTIYCSRIGAGNNRQFTY